MDVSLWVVVIILGVVEGLTEFLPISSTGHLIVVSTWLGFHDERGKLFEIVIQSGAILAVCWEYRYRLLQTTQNVFSQDSHQANEARRFFAHVAIAFVPLAVLGLLFGKTIKAHLFDVHTVAWAFIVGGFIILWVERRPKPVKITTLNALSFWDALKLGCMQALALIPGVSRSGATIIGGMYLGLSRQTATEFSFFLAIPTLLIATIYQLIKESHLLNVADWWLWLSGMVSAFVSAFVCVRWLLRYVATHDFTWFAWYRIAFGSWLLLAHEQGWISWHM